MSEPSTPAEWQDAVDAAQLLLLIDSARQYGLIDGGPAVDVERCVQVLEVGKARGYRPAPDAKIIQRALSEEGSHVDRC